MTDDFLTNYSKHALNDFAEDARDNARRHLSKSVSDLSSAYVDERAGSASPIEPGTSSVAHHHKTHGIFHALKHKWSRSRSKERNRRKAMPCAQDSTDYGADLSSEGSPNTQSPRHRLYSAVNTVADSPLARLCASTVTEMLPHRRRSTRGLNAENLLNDSPNIAVELQQAADEEALQRREAILRQHAFFVLRIHLHRGKDLAAMDKSGTSDPYVKFKIGGRVVHKSRTIHRDLNPVWDETFTIPIEDPFARVHIKVFDWDWGLQDDFMGAADVDLRQLDVNRCVELTVPLRDPAKPLAYLGEVIFTAELSPRTQEDKEQFYQRSNRLGDVNKKLKSQIWSSVVTVVLVEGKNLIATDVDHNLSDTYVRFRLGNERYKTKVFWRSINPRWLEQFDLHLYDDADQRLEVTVWDKERNKDESIGRCLIDLSALERERTHGFWRDLDDDAGALYFLLTISGTTASETISDLTTYENDAADRAILAARYSLRNTFANIRDVGHLTVKVYRATGLAAADLGGKSDPFCVLELGNARLQTQTEYKTLAPCWNKIFTFNVKDINNSLDVTVYDEDRDHKVEFLGKVSIPLLRVRNGEKRWYALKDKKLRGRAKGANPQVLLEIHVQWNPIRACLRTINPKEEKYMQPEVKFKRQVFVRNVIRLKAILLTFIEVGKIVQDCFEWESHVISFVGLMFWLVVCYYFEPYMLPGFALLFFLKQYVVKALTAGCVPYCRDDDESDGDEDDDMDEKDKEEKKSLKERLLAVQEVTQSVQNYIGYIASLGEAVKNLFNFTVPYLSWIAILLAATATIVLYFVPIRYLLMLWGINKFTRRILRPHTVPNNELLDLLSRVPDDEMLGFRGVGILLHWPVSIIALLKLFQLDYRELKLLTATDATDKRKSGKKHTKVN